MLIDALSIFVIVVVGLLYGWGMAVLVGVVVVSLGLWWKLGRFWTRDQRSRIRWRAQQRAGDRQV
ncbi:hypothetical protein RF644_17755 [Kocuria sp. CPCC 205258]|uniref:hypothetical protein n=1 Tax=Kocuria sp. CPCC 205258 TaxID=3073552 RepID=UPI0034D6F1AB